MTDRERIRALCSEIEARIDEALMYEGGDAYVAIESLVFEVEQIAKRLGMRRGPLRSKLLDNRTWLEHSTPEHGSMAGFVVRDYHDLDHLTADEQWRKVQDSMRRWVRWIDAGFESRTGYFKNPVVASEMQPGDHESTKTVDGPDPIADQQPPGPWHDAKCEPPTDFCHGPLTGNKRQLLRWILPHAKDVRTLDGQLKNGTYWGRQEGRYQFSIWFSTPQKYAEANRRRLEGQQHG